MNPIFLKVLFFSSMVIACGVKGPPEPPLINEANASQRVPAPAAESKEEATPPVIFKKESQPEKKRKKKQ